MLLQDLIIYVNKLTEKTFKFSHNHGVGHGIHRAVITDEAENKYLMKYTLSENQAHLAQLHHEANALRLLHELHVRTPYFYSNETFPGVILRFINDTRMPGSDLAENLVVLHSVTAERYGFHLDTYIASIPLDNSLSSSWAEFYWFNRIFPLLKIAIANGFMPQSTMNAESMFIKAIEKKVPKEPPCLIHGDLWSGNYLVDEHKRSFLIDPAIYYGHREMDIAMSKLFGGFDEIFYKRYNELLPIELGWEARLPYFQLYYLLVHVVLFGHSYVQQTLSAWEITVR